MKHLSIIAAGTVWTGVAFGLMAAFGLSLKDVIDRSVDFEMAYNPNDCVELRWAAPDNSAEASTCKRHAPREQRAKMTKYRTWF